MPVEQRLRSTLTDAAARIDVDDAHVDAVVQRAQRRSSRNRITASVAGLVVVLAAVLGISHLAGIGTAQLDVLGAPEGAQPVAVFLCDGRNCAAISEDERDRLRGELEGNPDVLQVTFESKQDAFHRFREEFADQPDLVRSVSPDALPSSFRVLLSADAEAERFADRYRSREGVQEVVVVTEGEPVFEGTEPPVRPDGSAP